MVLLARPGDGPAVPVGVLGVLGACALLIGGAAWVRLPWLRPAVLAVAALFACQFVPGPDLDAVLPAAAGLAVLAAVLTEEHHALFARPVLVGAVMAGVAAAALLVPAIPLPSTPNPVAEAVPVAAVARPQVAAVAIAIPSLDLSGPLDELGVADDGELLAPDDPSRAGWYAGGVVPGDLGPAIVGGHVDSRRGRGVFFALRSLRPATWSTSRARTVGSHGSPCPGCSRWRRTGSPRLRCTARHRGPSCGSSPVGAGSTGRPAATPTTWSSRR